MSTASQSDFEHLLDRTTTGAERLLREVGDDASDETLSATAPELCDVVEGTERLLETLDLERLPDAIDASALPDLLEADELPEAIRERDPDQVLDLGAIRQVLRVGNSGTPSISPSSGRRCGGSAPNSRTSSDPERSTRRESRGQRRRSNGSSTRRRTMPGTQRSNSRHRGAHERPVKRLSTASRRSRPCASRIGDEPAAAGDRRRTRPRFRPCRPVRCRPASPRESRPCRRASDGRASTLRPGSTAAAGRPAAARSDRRYHHARNGGTTSS